jgi:acetyl-CoA acyltransferase
MAARAIRLGEADMVIAGGVESMSRAPFVLPKAGQAFSRQAEIYDTTIGWRFVNPVIKSQYGVDSMPETGENVAAEFQVARADQDGFALRSQQRAAAAQGNGRLAREISAIELPSRKGAPVTVESDEHPRPETTLEDLARLATPFRSNGTVTAGNASGSTTARLPCCWPRTMRRAGMGWNRWRGSAERRSPGSRRASWASARCRPPRC